MAEFPKMPLWTDAYMGDTGHLTTIEHGAYLLLLITMWRNKGTLPADDRLLAKYTRLTSTQWARIKPVIMPFFKLNDGVISQGRLTDEYNAVRQHSAKQSDRAKARWLKTNDTHDATALPEESQSDATLSLSQSHTLTPIGVTVEAPPKKTAKRSCQLPEGWVPSEENETYAREQGLSESEITHEAAQFRDYHVSRGNAFKDWNATWRTWCRNSIKWRAGRVAGSPNARTNGQGNSFAAVAARRRLADQDAGHVSERFPGL